MPFQLCTHLVDSFIMQNIVSCEQSLICYFQLVNRGCQMIIWLS